MKIQIPKGLFDILPYGEDKPWRLIDYWHHIETVIRKLSLDYNYNEVRTPIFERTELFQRGVGKNTDIVSKEMYTFFDKANRSMSLRPEGTASIMRAFVEKNLSQKRSTHKFYYIAPMFRYDRPQAGRYRQHHQFGIEALGLKSHEQDVEVMDMLHELYHRLGITEVTLHINSVGDVQSRSNYKEALKKYLSPHLSSMSQDSQDRFENNPLRILDSKAKEDAPIIKQAPSILDYLSEESQSHFNKTLDLLGKIHLPYTIDEKLVRGLDYYNDTVFEFTAKGIGAQNSIGGGGRYDSLISDFGGPSCPGVGFGTGLERILQTLIEQNITLPTSPSNFAYFIFLDDMAKELCFTLSTKLRHLGIPVDMCLRTKKIQKSLQDANTAQAKLAIIIGEDELKNKVAQCKDLQSHTQKEITFDNIIPYLQNMWIDYKNKTYGKN
jgi:histidyl-tRNA synthetase